MTSSENRRVSVFLEADTFCSEGTGTRRVHKLCACAPVDPFVVGSLAILIAVTSGPVERQCVSSKCLKEKERIEMDARLTCKACSSGVSPGLPFYSTYKS